MMSAFSLNFVNMSYKPKFWLDIEAQNTKIKGRPSAIVINQVLLSVIIHTFIDGAVKTLISTSL
jgi:hypothetical protein